MPDPNLLVGWAIGFAVAAVVWVVGLLVLDRDPPRRQQRLAALAVTWGAALMPGAWIAVTHAVQLWWPFALGYLVVGAIGTYVGDLVAATAPPERKRATAPAKPTAPTAKSASAPTKPPAPTTPSAPTTPPAPTPPPVPRPHRPELPTNSPGAPPPYPLIRPPEGGGVAAATASVTSAETQGLLRSLEEGPDFQRPAAARALALAYADRAEPVVCRALLDAVDADANGVAGRAEAYLALFAVFGTDLPWETEVTVRRSFPEGLDPDQILAWEARLADGSG